MIWIQTNLTGLAYPHLAVIFWLYSLKFVKSCWDFDGLALKKYVQPVEFLQLWEMGSYCGNLPDTFIEYGEISVILTKVRVESWFGQISLSRHTDILTFFKKHNDLVVWFGFRMDLVFLNIWTFGHLKKVMAGPQYSTTTILLCLWECVLGSGGNIWFLETWHEAQFKLSQNIEICSMVVLVAFLM